MKPTDSKRLTIPIFVSSTFLDFQVERDLLKEIVLEVEEELQSQERTNLLLVDLRWGINTSDITDESKRENLVLLECLDAIDRCHPLFIGLLGDRYGSCFDAERMIAVAQQKELRLSDPKISVTALEIEYGVLASRDYMDHSLFYFRSLKEADFPESKKAQYFDEGNPKLDAKEKNDIKEKLDSLKDTIKEYFHKPGQDDQKVKEYTGEWEDKDGNGRLGNFIMTNKTSWREQIKNDIKEEILKRSRALREHMNSKERDEHTKPIENWISEELLLLDNFIDRHAGEVDVKGDKVSRFSGRDKLLQELLDHFKQRNPEQWGLVLTGESGSGKSAVFSKLSLELKSRGSEALILVHSAGISARSKRLEDLLKIWIWKLETELGFDITNWEEEEDHNLFLNGISIGLGEDHFTPRTQIDRLVHRFRELLFTTVKERPVYLLIDALDQFERSERAQYMTWLPSVLPDNVRIVCTAITGTDAKAREYHKSLLEKPMDVFAASDAEEMLKHICLREGKEMSAEVVGSLLEKLDRNEDLAVKSPLWVMLISHALLAMDQSDFESLSDKGKNGGKALEEYMLELVAEIPGEPGALLLRLIEKAGKIYGEAFTTSVFDLLACSRYGLRERDLEALIPRLNSKVEWDPLIFARLRRWFRGLLVNRGEEQQWDLGHTILRDLLDSHLNKRKRKIHQKISNYLFNLNYDFLKSTEVMYHLLSANDYYQSSLYYGNPSRNEIEISQASKDLIEYVNSQKDSRDCIQSMVAELIRNSSKERFDSTIYYDHLLNRYLHYVVQAMLDNRELQTAKIHLNDLLATDFILTQTKFVDKSIGRTMIILERLVVVSLLSGDIMTAEEDIKINLDYSNLKHLVKKDEDGLLSVCNTHRYLGLVYMEKMEFVKAEEHFSKYLQFAKKGFTLYNTNLFYLVIAEAIAKLSELSFNRTFFAQSELLCTKGIRILREFQKRHELSSSWAITLVEMIERIGLIYSRYKKLNKSLEQHTEQLNIVRKLLEKNPSSTRLKSFYAIGLERMGDVYFSLGKYEKASKYYQEENDMFRYLANAFPSWTLVIHGLVSSSRNYCKARRMLSRFAEERELLNQAITCGELLVSLSNRPKYIFELVLIYEELGDNFRGQNLNEKARRTYEKAIQVCIKFSLLNYSQYSQTKERLDWKIDLCS